MNLDFNRLIAEAVRDMAGERGLDETLDRVLRLCTEAVEHCEMVGISILEDDQVRTLAASDETLRRVDQVQFELKQGPCYEALVEHEVIAVNDLADESRYPQFGPRLVEETGLRSSLSYRLYTSQGSLGSINLYSSRTHAFDSEDVERGRIVAAHASAALAAAFNDVNLQNALRTRTVIGQATGILIERFAVDPAQAFSVLRRMSQNHNIKLSTLAQHLVDTGALTMQGSAATQVGQDGLPPGLGEGSKPADSGRGDLTDAEG